jgi:hypothetical protein
MSSSLKLFTVASGLAFLVVATASAGDRDTCSNNMLKGHYAHLIQGAFGPGPLDINPPFSQTYGGATPFQGIQMLEFDGKGSVTGSESLVAGGGELTNNNGKHFTPVVGTFTINADCTGIGYLCSNHSTPTVSGGPNTCNANTIDTPGFLWENFIQVTIVLAERGRKFHMLAVPPYDTGGAIRTISGTGTRLEDVSFEPFK